MTVFAIESEGEEVWAGPWYYASLVMVSLLVILTHKSVLLQTTQQL